VSPVAINAAGHVAGDTFIDVEEDVVARAVFFADCILTVLEAAPSAESSSASDLNVVDQVVGSPSGPPDGRAFLYDHATGTMTDLGTLPGYQDSTATAINNVGQVVGHAWFALNWVAGNETDQIQRAVVYDHRTRVMTDLNGRIPPGRGWYLVDAFDISDTGQIVGRGLRCGQMHAFVLTPADPRLWSRPQRPDMGSTSGSSSGDVGGSGTSQTQVPGTLGRGQRDASSADVIGTGTGGADVMNPATAALKRRA
jgi:uncharacterized membrane protein